jgi:hypothetical protein
MFMKINIGALWGTVLTSFTFRSTANSVRELTLRGRALNAASPSGTRANSVESGTVTGYFYGLASYKAADALRHFVIYWASPSEF